MISKFEIGDLVEIDKSSSVVYGNKFFGVVLEIDDLKDYGPKFEKNWYKVLFLTYQNEFRTAYFGEWRLSLA